MSSDDDYYVELYERHAEARKGRRARRRGSGGNGASAGRRGLDKYRGQKTRRSKGCVLQNSMRIAGVVFIAVIAAYELYLFREPGTASASEKTDIVEKLSVAADEEGSYSKNLQKSVDGSVSDSSGDDIGIVTSGESLAPPAVGQAMASTNINTNASERADQLPPSPSPAKKPQSVKTGGTGKVIDGEAVNSKEEVPAYGPLKKKAMGTPSETDKSRESDDKGESVPSTHSEGTAKSRARKKAVHSTKKSGEEDETEIDSESADSEAGSSEEPRKKVKSKKGKPDRDDQAKLNSGSSEVGSEPGAKENFWKWFQDSKVTEGTGASSVECPEENHKLCQMFYKYARKYKIRSVFDASCGKNLAWMGVPLKKISNELWGFKYYCGEPDASRMEEAKEVLKEFSFVEFDDRKWWKSGFPEGVELLFAWDTLAHTAFGRVWSFFVNVRKQDIKWVLVDNYPAIMNDPSPKRQYINLRKHPFRFPAATAVVQDVRETGEEETVKRQLLLYEGSALPDNLG